MVEAGETYICVDVETAGPIPGDYSLLSIGACTIDEPPATFYIELKPVNKRIIPEVATVHGLSMGRLAREGVEPRPALLQFEAWLINQSSEGSPLVFVAFNAPFDWMFVNFYFMHYLGRNPFGHTALDIKALYMGLAKIGWTKTAWRFIDPHYLERQKLTHHALQDALDQAGLFIKLLQELHRPKETKRR
jgi:DNA polymerase III epsilon subunit-like protein